MKKSKSEETEYRMYFMRLKKEDDADIINWVDAYVTNFTEYFRTLVRRDIEENQDKQRFIQLNSKIGDLEKSYQSLKESNEEIKDLLLEIKNNNSKQ